MNIITTADGQYYRRWVNIIPSLFIPGSGHFLSGRKKAGIIWFCFALLLGDRMLWIFLSTKIPSLPYSTICYWIVALVFSLVVMADSCRCPIPKIGFKGWFVFSGIFIVTSFVPVFLVHQFLVHPFTISSMSMSPTFIGAKRDAKGKQLSRGDYVLVNKLIYYFKNPQRGDIAVFNISGVQGLQKNKYFCMRIVGIPGDTVRINPPYIIVNGQKLLEPPIFAKISSRENGYSGYLFPQAYNKAFYETPKDGIRLFDNEYLVFGDNATNSYDSRYFGAIKRSSIIGKVFYIYAPAERKGRVE
ncbi:MAG: signal peptidase I [Kiritimatiellae bacterium]|nr:signal peptidase I [Kiritimatiellia bacterium]